MTPLREAIVLPALFLTVVLMAAVRPGAEATLSPPPPSALVVAMALIALLVRSGAVAPERLMHGGRTTLANLNGFVLLLAVFAASAQAIAAVVPERGVPALTTWVVLLSLLLQAFAMQPDRARLLRGLLVTFGAAFALKFVVLAALSTPPQGRVATAVRALFEGITLGAVTQRPVHAAEPYLTFAAIVIYLIGVALLPTAMWHMVRVATTRQLPADDNVT